MKILVIGATGAIGSAVVQAALDGGHEVTAFVRSPDKLGELASRVHLAVINAVGSSPDQERLDVPANGMRAVIEAMRMAGVRRLVGLSGGAVDVPGERKPLGGRITTAIVSLLARNVVAAKQREFDVVAASDLDWTMVRPPNVVQGPATGRAEIGHRLRGFRISSGDVGAAMVRLATSQEFTRAAPYVSQGAKTD